MFDRKLRTCAVYTTATNWQDVVTTDDDNFLATVGSGNDGGQDCVVAIGNLAQIDS